MATKQGLSKFMDFSKKIIGIGRNYKHAPNPLVGALQETPFLFTKPPSAFIKEGQSIKMPSSQAILIHEVELGIVIGREGCSIPASRAMDHVGGYILALDMTDGYELKLAKEAGMPWIFAKEFDTSCPVSDFIPKEHVQNPDDLQLWCKVNGETRQDGNTRNMVYSVAELISWISDRFRLLPGDVILTGTPDGHASVALGDRIDCGLGDVKQMTFYVDN